MKEAGRQSYDGFSDENGPRRYVYPRLVFIFAKNGRVGIKVETKTITRVCLPCSVLPICVSILRPVELWVDIWHARFDVKFAV